MKKLLLIISMLTGAAAAHAQLAALTADKIMARASSKDTVYIINFWATWCAPCVQELPEFDELYKIFADKPVKILMVSLDFKDAYPYKLEGFVQRKKMKPEVVWLSDTNPNTFIPKIDENWQGSIPATLIIRPGGERKFIEGQTTAAQVSILASKL